MATVPETTTTRKPLKAFYAHLDGQAVTLVKANGRIWVLRDDSIEPFEVAMVSLTVVLGEVGVADTQRLMDVVVQGGYAAVACGREQEVA